MLGRFAHILLAAVAVSPLNVGATSPLNAAATPSASSKQATVTLLGGWQEGDGTRVGGLEIILADGWKTYWRQPGTAGLPPRFDWSQSRNLGQIEVEWPAPAVFDSFGVQTIGYVDDVVLPLRMTPVDPARPVMLDGVLEIGICADICVPVRAHLRATWAPGATDAAARVQAQRKRVPVPAAEGGIGHSACAVRGAGERRRFEARLAFEERPANDPMVLVEGPEAAWFGPVSIVWSGSVLEAEAVVETYDSSAWIARDRLRLTLLWPDRAVSVDRCAAL